MSTVTRRTRRAAVQTTSSNWFASPWRIAARAVGSAIVILILGALLALLVVPRMLGGDSLTVLSGSMEPTFSPGDVVVVKGVSEEAVCTDLSVGSIVTYFPEPNDPTLITHRIVGKTIGTFDDGTACRLITQGDANTDIDDPVSPAQVRGAFMYGVPGLGWVRQWVSQNPAILIGVAVAALVGWGLWSSLRRPRTTVMTVPRPASTSPAAAPPNPAPVAEPRERELRERELELRERELELRERELAFAMETRGTPDPAEPEPGEDSDPASDQSPDPEPGAAAVAPQPFQHPPRNEA